MQTKTTDHAALVKAALRNTEHQAHEVTITVTMHQGSQYADLMISRTVEAINSHLMDHDTLEVHRTTTISARGDSLPF